MSRIHPTAIVSDGAQLGADVEIGPYCVIGPHVTIGEGTQLIAHVVVDGHTTIGRGARIFPFACVGMIPQDLKYAGGTSYIEIGDRTTLRESVTVNLGTHDGEVTRIGAGCLLMAYSHVAHACQVGNEVIMANCATLAGESTVEDQAIIGGLTGVHQFCRVGRLCMVGGCTKVVKDLPPFMIVDGNPARVRGVNRIGMERRGIGDEARKTLREAFRILYREGVSMTRAAELIQERLEPCPELAHLLDFVAASKRGVTR